MTTCACAVRTVIDCWISGAGRYRSLPLWSASTVQVPAMWNDTVPPEIEQTPADASSMWNDTGNPDVEVADGRYVVPSAG